MIGLFLNERYRLDSELGRGGMGAVYRAHDTLLGRDVAVKIITGGVESAEIRARLLREAQTAARLNHPNIISVYDAGEVALPPNTTVVPFVVMELIEGASLYERKPDGMGEILRIARQICAALDHAHRQGFIHRDLKPENVLFTADGTVKLTDIGLARAVVSLSSDERKVVGTIYYMAPEIIGQGDYDNRVDLYALGVMLYELSTGQLPFTADDPAALLSQHLHAPVIPPRAKNPAISAELDALVVKLMSKRPDERPESAAEVLVVLERIELSTSVVAKPLSTQMLLETKFYIPSVGKKIVYRPRLFERLNHGVRRKLTLLSAPAGFGKTTLLSAWIEHQGKEQEPLQVAWLSLDSDDNNPARFLTYFVAALQKVDVSFGEEDLSVLQAFQIASITEIWEILATQIVSHSSPFVFVLDDYHLIETPIINESIAFMLEQMPPCMHLVISTRADPPFPLSRLRVRSELVELRAGDLRFSSEEIARYLDLWIGKKLPTADQAELEARTEGWIAGLQLAALAMQSLAEQAPGEEDSLSAFVHRLSGNTRFIMDYLVEEVLQRLPEDSRSFLLQTSVLERLTAPLCDAVTDRSDSQIILDSLEKTNLFLFPLDDERRWYRYHHLFADLLRSFLHYDQPARVPELHAKASVWCESQGLMTEAIQHALKIPDPGEAARLMEKASVETLLRGEVTTIQNWSTWISEEQARQRPYLCVCFAWVFLLSDKVELAERYLSLVNQDQIVFSPYAPDHQGNVMSAYSMLAFCKGDYEEAIQYASQAVEQLPAEQTFLGCMFALSSGAADEMIGEDEAAFQAYEEAKQISHAFGNRTAELSALKNLGDLQMRRGQLHQAAHSYSQALRIGSIGDGHLLPVAAQTVAAMGQLLYERDQLEEAEHYLLQGVELSRKLENTYALLSTLQNLARIHWIQGERESALRLRDESEQVMLESPPLPSFADQVAVQQVRMYLRMGETQNAIRFAQLHGQNWQSGHAYPIELMAILWARVWLAQENATEAIETIEHALPLARAAERWGVVIELLVLQALAQALARQTTPALATLEEALRLAEPEGYTRIFLDEGEPMARLLRMVYRSKEKGSREYETRLLEELLSAEAPAPPASPETPSGKSMDRPILIDPLTERELEILRMIADGYSNQEIGEKLVITVGTVKAHISHIYGKLDVRSRTQAIVKADRLHLLNP